MITLNEGGKLVINNWTFQRISSYEEGSILHAGYRKTTAVISDSIFSNNTSIKGGIFSVDSESIINIIGCSIYNTFAVNSGVIHASNNGYFNIINSEIYNNYAISSSVSQIIDVSTIPIIENTTFHDNLSLVKEKVAIEVNIACFYLWFMQKAYQDYLKANPKIYQVDSSSFIFQLIQANIIFRNGVKIYNSQSIINSFISTFTISDSLFYNITAVYYAFKMISTNANISNWVFKQITTNNSSSLFQASFESTMYIQNITFANSSLPLLSSTSSDIAMQYIIIDHIISSNSLIDIRDSLNFKYLDSVLTLSNSNTDWLIHISTSAAQIISNITVDSTINSPFWIHSSTVDIFEKVKLEQWSNHLVIDLSKNKASK